MRRRARTAVEVACAAAMLLVAAVSSAQPLTIVAPAAPGGGWDQTARALQHAFSTVDPASPIQVENVPGAAGTIGLARFVSAERGRPDALLVTGLVMVSGIVATRSVVSLADVTPIARLTGEDEVIVVPASSPHRTLQDLVDAFRREPRRVSWGGGSAGGTDDLLARLIAEAVGVPPADVNYVAFSGGGEALAALLGGQVTTGVSGLGEFAQSLAAGQLRALAVASPQRVAGLDAPTLREAGVPLDLDNWRAVVAPPGLSDADAARLAGRVRQVVQSPAWRETLARTGWRDLHLDGPPFRQFLLSEQARVEAVLRRLQSDGPAAASRWTPTSATLPRLALIATGVLLAWHVGRSGVRDAAGAGVAIADGGVMRLTAIVGAVLLHAVAQPIVGFVPTGTAVFVAGACALGSTRWRRDVVLGLAVTSVIALVFAFGLGVPLPPPGAAWVR